MVDRQRVTPFAQPATDQPRQGKPDEQHRGWFRRWTHDLPANFSGAFASPKSITLRGVVCASGSEPTAEVYRGRDDGVRA
jgi:hypothetical protein